VKVNKRHKKTPICIGIVALLVIAIAGCSSSTTSSSSNTGRVTAQYQGNGLVRLTANDIAVGRVPHGKGAAELTFFKLEDSSNNAYIQSGTVEKTFHAGYSETVSNGMFTERHGTISLKGTGGTDVTISANGSSEDVSGTIYFPIPRGVSPQKLIYDDGTDSFTINLQSS
jgi:hypothetical protein